MPGKAIRLRGIVQGVGFRPYIWHLARDFGLTGSVWNDSEGVMIHVFGEANKLQQFIEQIPLQLPPLARLDGMESADLQLPAADGFQILTSRGGTPAQTPIASDAATCPDCLADIADPLNRRYRYPFTHCTHCGPRLSIVRRVPYDRQNTSMAVFTLCHECQQEYEDPTDRRFHAQANCCPACGPKLWLEDGERRMLAGDPIAGAAELIRLGHIVAIKGLGGFHLACNAADAAAVARLRERKRRYAKPFALMARDLAMIARYVRIDALEAQALTDKAAPIVLLTAHGEPLATGVAPGDDKLGFMLPYTPLHSLLMAELNAPIVLTSGNISDEPPCTDNDQAREKLAGIADFWLLHDRDIVNRLDDSVVRVMDGKPRLLRRARGYSPQALALPKGFEDADGILAMGAELKNSFCLIRGGQAIVSQHIGDLENAAVLHDYQNALALYRQQCGFHPKLIAVDKHPGYFSSQHGQTLAAQEQIPLIDIAHHHAHLAACLAEHGVPLDARPVLGALFDGLGLGEDGSLCGGEFVLADYRNYTRLAQFQPIALPGGSQAMHEPWRNAYAQLSHYFDWNALQRDYSELEIMRLLTGKPLATLDAMIAKNLNSPPSSSCGRWFDAFAAALGLHAEKIAYEGQAAMALETLAAPLFAEERAYPGCWSLNGSDSNRVLVWRGLWQAVLDDLRQNTDKARIAARIHHSLISAASQLLIELSAATGADTVVLSGGVMQNRLVLEGLSQQLRAHGKTVLSPRLYPANDGGLSLGQAVIAAARQRQASA